MLRIFGKSRDKLAVNLGSQYVFYRCKAFSIRFYPRSLLVGFFTFFSLLTVSIISLCLGEFPISLKGLMLLFVGQGSEISEFIIFQVRVPRILAGAIAGFCLGLSGAIFQTLTRNPLASPDLIGITVGASLGAVVTIVLIGGNGLQVAFGALIGVILVTGTIAVLSWQKRFDANRFVLVGIGIGLAGMACIDFLLTRADIMRAENAYLWLTGSLNAVDKTKLDLGFALILPFMGSATWLSAKLDTLDLGEDVAMSLGIKLVPLQIAAVAIALIAVTCAVFIAGPVAFIALASGPIARSLIGKSPAIFVSALMGSFILVTADLAARMLFSPTEISVGILTSVLGGLFIIWLMMGQAKKVVV